jgi:small subunit ribosomal protein S1
MDWTNKNVHPSKLVHVGQEVDVVILDIDQERRRISLGMKQCQPNPWDQFAATQNKGDRVSGVIKSITDFGIFIGLDGGIDGLVHLSDVTWSDETEEAIRKFKKGEEVEAVVLAVDAERERISLGIKQLERDPFSNYVAEYPKGSIVKAKVTGVEAKSVTVQLADGIEGQLKASELSNDRKVEDARMAVKEGDELEVKITAIDRKKRTINVSVKAKESDEESAAVREYAPNTSSGAKLGDILKGHLDNNQG